MDSSKVLIVGSTGYIGTWITKACLASSRHQTFLLTGPTTHASIHKLPLLLSYKQEGATLVEASLDDHESLVSLLSGIDYVISAIAENQIEQQLKLVRAIKQVGTIKRFLPSEYGVDPDFMEHSIAPGSVLFEQKRKVRRAIEESGIPHTYVIAHCFAGYFLSGLASFGRFWPPAAKVQIYGDGNHKVVWMVEEDIGKYVVKAMDDVRTLNRTIYVRPPSNIKSQMEVVNLWEALSGKTLQKEHITEQQWLQNIQDENLPWELRHAFSIFYHIFFEGVIMSFPINHDNEASSLYPEESVHNVNIWLNTLRLEATLKMIKTDFFAKNSLRCHQNS
ncbi:bifunctional pinoresinol-lariciresinol reductase 2-like [Nymphaea colorata]|uniref:bifunctional pinoresinol-lariciresinol reductase 2-like n=1 Tax=Nymphaea colorata TaxID=210225 RepID=UPI00214F57C8|nr:bifunctional pinoresinol-lariciresinol reductase 2-like [Nymphaea colorata]